MDYYNPEFSVKEKNNNHHPPDTANTHQPFSFKLLAKRKEKCPVSQISQLLAQSCSQDPAAINKEGKKKKKKS